MRVIGLDPGLRRTGWGVIEAVGSRLSHVANGAVSSDDARALAERLVQLKAGLEAVIDEYRPGAAAVEETLANRNPASTLKLGMARGVALLVPALAGLPVAQYLPMVVKKSVVGTGHARKEQVAMMVERLLPGCHPASPDAADALAVAICHAHHLSTAARWAAGRADPLLPGGSGWMIGKLTGHVDDISEDGVILDVGGVGYLVFASARTLAALAPGAAASLRIETHVREDHIHLYGFLEIAERDWFRLLITVQGVGARHGLAILSVLAPAQLAQAIAAQDRAAVSRANGVGPKLAQRIVSELKDKAGGIALGAAAAIVPAGAPGGLDGAAEDAISALVNLGYRRSDAFTAVAQAARKLDGQPSLEALIKGGLKELAR